MGIAPTISFKKVVKFLGLEISQLKQFQVMVENVDRLSCNSICFVLVSLGDTTFCIDFYVLTNKWHWPCLGNSVDENTRSNPLSYTALTLQFKWLHHRNCLQGMRDTNIRQITSNRLNAMNSISAYYHLALFTIDTNSTINLSSVPSIIHPLL